MTLRSLMDRVLGIEPVYAHCDVPCGIYDPHGAQLAAKTVFTMVKKMTDLPMPPMGPEGGQQMVAYRNAIIRMTKTKEDHAEICKKELLILWTDYFKPENAGPFPDLHETFWKAAKLCSANKQNVDLGKAQELIDATNKVAEMFQKAEAAKKK